MKFTLLALLAASVAANLQACVETVEDGVDYFPDKVEALYSKTWDIEYFGTYKVLTNTGAGTTYLLYQCGTEPPADEVANGGHHAVLEIPLKKVGITSTPYIAFFEQLESIELISHFLDDEKFINTPCLKDRIASGDVSAVQEDRDGNGITIGGGQLGDFSQPVFMSPPFEGESPYQTSIFVTEYFERTNAAIFEWVKFYSAFFNLEALANEVMEAAEDRWACVAENANLVESDLPKKPTILWAYYSDFCNGWDVGECPNYYCEMANACAADILNSTEGVYNPDCFANYMTTEQFVEFGKDADYWIYNAPDWDTVYPKFKDQLDTMNAVKNQEVYDTEKSTGGWFEQRLAEYYNVLRDFCHVVGTQRSLTGRGWFRNVFTEETVDPTECVKSSILEDEFACIPGQVNVPMGSGVAATSFIVASSVATMTMFILA